MVTKLTSSLYTLSEGNMYSLSSSKEN